MICIICRLAEIMEGYTDVTLQRGEIHLVITAVPAQVCPVCGEAFVAEEVATQLLKRAAERVEAGVRDDQYAYGLA